MKTVNCIAYFRSDLKDEYKDKVYSEIIWPMFSISGTGVILHEDIALFVDDDGSTKIIKNRYDKSRQY